MHELSLANGIFDIVRHYVPIERAPYVRSVHVRVGEDAAVLPESLAWCFSAITTNTEFARAFLVVEREIGQDLRVSDIELEEETP